MQQLRPQKTPNMMIVLKVVRMMKTRQRIFTFPRVHPHQQITVMAVARRIVRPRRTHPQRVHPRKATLTKNYDEGYDDVYMDDDYDLDRYNKDRDYADGVDDAEEDEEEYGEDW